MDFVTQFKQVATDERLVTEISEMTKNELFYEEAERFFTVKPGIKGGQHVVALDPLEYVTKKDEGCTPTFDTYKMSGIDQKWEPTLAKVRIQMCHSEFEQSFLQWSVANGYNIKDLGQAEFINFIIEQISKAMEADFIRLALFGDENIATQNILKNAAKAPYYDVVKKGLIPTLQYFKTIPELAGQFIELDKNAAATRAEQMNLGATYALELFEKLTDEQFFDSNQILTSNSLFKNYKHFLQRGPGNTPLESSKQEIQSGIESLLFDGEALTPIKFYDKKRAEDFTNTKTHLPHFALNTSKENLVIGIDDKASLSDLRLEYVGGKDENFYIKANYMIDFKILNPKSLRAAL